LCYVYNINEVPLMTLLQDARSKLIPRHPARVSSSVVALAAIVGIGLLCVDARAQRAIPANPRAESPTPFEVVSVKPIPATEGGSAAPVLLPGRVEYHGATLKNLVAGAYDTQVSRIIEGPGYTQELNKYRFNIEAKTGLSAAPTQILSASIRPMVKELLRERFSVQVRMEQRVSRFYVLTVGKKGPAFKPVPDAETRVLVTRIMPGAGRVDFQDASLTSLANTMGGYVGEPVLNQTGLTGYYNFTWQWILDDGSEITPPQAMENLGLKLEERRGPVEFVVIETARMPTPN
jgi:uncharacterized protein (TIGR03435 family)